MTVQRILREASPEIIFLSETKNAEDVVLKKLNWMNYEHHQLVPPHGQGGGGLALFWKQNIDLSIITACDNYIDSKLLFEGKAIYITLVYGDPDRAKRKAIWDKLGKGGRTRESRRNFY